jgi:acetyl esterase/lipase
MLDHGVSIAAINYRLTERGKNPYPIPMLDGARALQFLRYHAEEYNLDKTRVASTGVSAGGCMTLWLGLHDDLADPDNEDHVLRESTRLTAMAPIGAQSSLHLPTLLKWFNIESLQEHGGGRPLFAVPAEGEIVMTPELDALTREASPITHLSKDDPPAYMVFGANKPVTETSPAGLWVHHPIMGIKLREAMDELGLECHVDYSGGPKDNNYEDMVEFLLKKLDVEKVSG